MLITRERVVKVNSFVLGGGSPISLTPSLSLLVLLLNAKFQLRLLSLSRVYKLKAYSICIVDVGGPES